MIRVTCEKNVRGEKMKQEFKQNINSLFKIVLSLERKEQEKYYDAVNSDASDSTKLMTDANVRINKIRDVIEIIKNIHINVLEIFEDADVPIAEECSEDTIVNVCEALILSKPYGFLSMNSEFVSVDRAKLKEPFVQLSNSMYVSTAEPARVICKEILSKCGIKEHEYGLYYKGA